MTPEQRQAQLVKKLEYEHEKFKETALARVTYDEQRIKELESLYADSCSALNEHMEIHAQTVNKVKELEAEVVRLIKLMDPIDQQCCEEQAKWKAEAQWAAACLEAMSCYVSSKIVDRAQRILKGEL